MEGESKRKLVKIGERTYIAVLPPLEDGCLVLDERFNNVGTYDQKDSVGAGMHHIYMVRDGCKERVPVKAVRKLVEIES